MEIDKLLLDASLARLHHLVPSQVELAKLVSEVVQAVTEIFDLTGAGVLLVDADRALRSIAASDSNGALFERAQEEFGEGPCVESFITDEIVVCADIASDPRWPRVTPTLVEGGIRAVLGVPVRLGGGPIGTLNVAADKPRAWNDTERDAMVHFGAVLENLLLAGLIADRNDKLARQLQYALEYRVPIERAVGYLMATMKTDQVSAFETLRRTARNERRRVSELAEEILARQRVL
ncbi:GAF and ANTAR domain-containing protein [Frankia sp. QA3]|uniref:GAF and ANTAR domain-containing protein n=1 Tax=Frankia sp. QA3 TaxID=710111 RepID=UPI000269CB42|nr:GAF and ANTAR domain-containing protein [Frankia sp. QA3]EIV95297.1 GAF domain-containing protein [Frankia sp. QA3]